MCVYMCIWVYMCCVCVYVLFHHIYLNIGTSHKGTHIILDLCVWFISLIIFSSVIHIVACVRVLFLFKADQYSIVCICRILFIHSSVVGHVGCSHLCLLWITLLWTWVYSYLFESLLPILWGEQDVHTVANVTLQKGTFTTARSGRNHVIKVIKT